MRGFKKDIPGTAKRREAGVYRDKRSFRSLCGHDLLYGPDKAMRRYQIFLLRNPDGIPEDSGEWDHEENDHNDHRRCDCVEGGRFILPQVHRAKHVKPMWSKNLKTEAANVV